ncbi:MAG: hypothetical protein NTV94_18405 [Planctomycetota bacterium]|nr:hypothetical protein [Planctomycetota bacterium]
MIETHDLTSPLLLSLNFKIEVMSQVLIVSTLLAGIAIGIATTLLSASERSRLRTLTFVCFTIAALLFIIGTLMDVCILPAMKHHAQNPDERVIPGLITLSRVVVFELLAGLAVLTGGIGLLGFSYSRKAGLWTAGAAATVALSFVVFAFVLDSIVRR